MHGEIVARLTWTYDGAREVFSEEEGIYRWTNWYDERDRVIGIEYLNLVTEQIEGVTTMHYDDLDRRTEYTRHTVDGMFDSHISWEYCD